MAETPGRLNLVLFFTRGISLSLWDEMGLFDREVALYRRIQAWGVDLSFLTHGDARDLALAGRLPGIRVLCNRWGLPGRVYRALLPWLHRRALRGADLIKTNQTHGADIALRTAHRFGKPLIARCGYMLSKNQILEHGPDSPQAKWALALEAKVFNAADRVVVTAESMRESVLERFPALAPRISVIPNFVDTDLFCPAEGSPRGTSRLICVGRLSPEKNLKALIQAVHGLDIELDIIGKGPQGEELQELAAGNARVHLLGPIPHSQLPERLCAAAAFVLPSLYEGHPKALIEAMACGLPIIATDVSGTRDIVTHGESGFLCGADAESLRAAIQTVLADVALRHRLGRQAREFVVEHFSLERIAEQELALLHEVAERSPGT